MCLLFVSGEIKHYPNLFNTGIPLYYLFAPAAYLYVRLLLSSQKRLKKYDWLHLMPSILALIGILPFIFKGSADKQRTINMIVHDPGYFFTSSYFIIPQKIHFLIRKIQAVIYLFFQWKFTLSFNKENMPRPTKRWIYYFNILVSFLTIAIGIMVIKVFFIKDGYLGRESLSVCISIGMFSLGIGLFFFPHLLYDMKAAFTADNIHLPDGPSLTSPLPILAASDEVYENKLPQEDKKSKELIITGKVLADIIIKLEEKLEKHQLYRQKGLTIYMLATQLNVSTRNLSYLLNQHYKLRFNDFINIYRIRYVKQKIKEGFLSNLTIEALAEDAGFSSRSTFYTVFKRKTGMSPAEYIAKLPDTASKELKIP
ncbi:AraC family transcriptional regulator [Pedobacter sp. BS3]|uniref:helix-turn-helix domain-containing protein n=1 Tax=Pedobacter sp. BS3 TaxID=2567937 RepID=UPI0011EC9447|nr:helix-turn-helix domain-containing protein [Pedobacter sp. BS3]TZF81538.1 AraC family transcriptional regulator [Pedobacter sp. BS3]